ncbi:MAG: hypothetical protein LBR60_03350 [Fibrobacter sp.]|nr:hypothetical protein [Fibrobacter sp.]
MKRVTRNTLRKATAPMAAGFAFLLILFSNGPAQTNNELLFKPEARKTQVQAVDTTQSNAYKFSVDVFSDGIIGVPFILLWEAEDISNEMKELISSRNFAKDEFFMQNIDREQFEQERLLQLFEDRKREYFLIFPEEALKALEDEEL